ncbi:hypothetical protein B0H14DRAFT_3518199 [Mycena olivaceomarginata]|nr:hypothetical protein B0H14DRAFT_3518199 [Mycena olivaceomarginata]
MRKTRGKSKKAELPAYVPPQPVPLMDTVSLAAETLASQHCEPLVFDAGCANCILRDRECDHGAPRSLCEHCEKGRLSHCTHNFSVVDHARAANHLEPYTRLSNERGNELITDLSAAQQLFRASARIAVASNRVSTWIRGVITNLGVYGLPRITEIPEALRPLWGQLLEDAEADLSVEYRAAIQRYPFISDPRRADLPSDEDLPTLIEFLTRRAARAHEPTPPPEEESNWPDHLDRSSAMEFLDIYSLQFLSRWFNLLHLLVKPSACVWLVTAILEPRFFPMKIVMLGLISSILIAPLLSIFGTTLPFHIDLLKEIFSIPPLLIEKLHYMVYKRALE